MEFTDFTFRKGVGDSALELESDVLCVVLVTGGFASRFFFSPINCWDFALFR